MLRPAKWKPALQAARSLWFDYGHLHTVLTGRSVDALNQPIPWYTYPAVEYLKQLDFSDATVFEYGAGNSTLFWAKVAKQVVSVDDDEAWYEQVKGRLPGNCTLAFEADLSSYVHSIVRYGHGFDVIVVDGAARGKTRLKCSRVAIDHLRPGGMIILDNSDWLPESTRTLREAGLIQVDMTGFVPIGGRTQTTSFFLHREFRFKPRGDRQPMPGPGAQPNVWEHPQSSALPLVEVDGETFGGVTRNEAFRIETPTGIRQFRLIVAIPSPAGPSCAAIVDDDLGRVLISLTAPGADVGHGTALESALRLPWDDFCGFINRHDKKRYRVEPLAVCA
jgi:hypothetical protein